MHNEFAKCEIKTSVFSGRKSQVGNCCLSSHGSPAKGGPKSKCLARVKIAQTSAGPPSFNIGPVPLSRSVYQYRTRPAFPLPPVVAKPARASDHVFFTSPSGIGAPFRLALLKSRC